MSEKDRLTVNHLRMQQFLPLNPSLYDNECLYDSEIQSVLGCQGTLDRKKIMKSRIGVVKEGSAFFRG